MKKLIYLIFLSATFSVYGQPICEAFRISGDSLKYKACKKAEEAKGHYQFTKAYQEILDEALQIDSSYAYAYQAKGYAYLKSGDFVVWEQLMGKAVTHDPEGYLGYRGWCRYQFFRDYQGAIKDIERLEAISKGEIGFAQNGDYHLKIAKALCYKALGEQEKAITIILDQLKLEDHFVGLYDYLHLGKLYLEVGQFDKALAAFQKQDREYALAENEFYWALSYKELQDTTNYHKHLSKAKELYLKGRHMFDPYTHQMDRIFLKDIEIENKKAGIKTMN